MGKSRKTRDPELVMETAMDLLRSVCRCGHLSSDHFLDERLRHAACSDCACRRFEQANLTVTVTTTKERTRI